ncbi:protein tolkin-like [Microplitis mediator]|uniref:protein tolkin-like n=1 Tax=Microplitis mediator TaxID=375433 RepID=UPI0025523CB4|nr:protein tolkin-like [Microplitis mediator]
MLAINSHVISDKNINYDKVNVTEKTEYQKSLNRTQRAIVVLNKTKLWKGGIIPYHFYPVVTGPQRRIIKKAMRKWENRTCIQFVLRNKEIHADYLRFTQFDECPCCYVEQKYANTTKFIGLHNHCYKQQIVLHELGHAIGFLHEHNHPDRDKYIEIKYFNVDADQFDQYNKYSTDEVDTLSLPYDYRSIMHYAYNLSSTDPKSRTIVPIPNDQNENSLVANDNLGISNGDIAATNLLYECSSCGETLYEPSGAFEQPINNNNFTSNDVERCEWRIRAAEGERIKLEITSLKIYQTYNCLFDYLEIRNGNSPNSPILGTNIVYDIYISIKS